MKAKRTALMMVLLLGLLLLPMAALADINVDVNGQRLAFDVPPAQIGGRVMVPLRGIFEALGATVVWEPVTKTILANREATSVQLTIGNPQAMVNGKAVTLDTPALILKGSTMVPVRFVSEALGAEVKWMSASQTVDIKTSVNQVFYPYVVPAGTVVPVKMDQAVSSATAKVGDAVSVTVRSAVEGDAEFPMGTKLSGVVKEVQRKEVGKPGVLDLAFSEAALPDGRKVKVNCSLVSLDEQSVMKTADGRLVAKDQLSGERLKFIALGAGAGLILGKLTKSDTTTSTLLGAAAGYLYGELNKDKLQYGDVTVAAGTEFGLRLDGSLTYQAGKNYIDARTSWLSAQAAKRL